MRLTGSLLLAAASMSLFQASGAESRQEAPLVGRLIDQRTGEAIPEFVIELHSTSLERFVTDAEGRFESAPHRRGRVSLILLDDDRSPRPARGGRVRTTHDPARKGERTLEIEIGPTYTLELMDPQGSAISCDDAATRFHAELFHDPPLTEKVVTRTADGEWITEPVPRAPLRSRNGRLWTRFRDLTAENRFRGAPWWLEIRDEAGLLAGGTRVDAVHGIEPRTMRIQLTRRAVFETVGEKDLSIDRLESLADGSIQPLPESGTRWLHPGTFEIASSRFEITPSVFELPPGRFALSSEGLTLSRRSRTGAILCSATERTTDALEEGFELRLEPLDAPHEAPIVRLAEEELRFEGLSHRPYTLTCRGNVAWDGLEVGEPILPLRGFPAAEVSLDIDTSTANLVLLAVDAEDGALLEDAEFRWQHGEYVDWTSARDDGRVHVLDLPVGDWALRGARATLRAPGYLDREVDLAEFVQQASDQAFRVTMERGWSSMLVAYDRRSRTPLAGVTASLDGVRQATSGVDGRIPLRADALPDRLDLELEGYSWVDGDIDWLRYDLLAQEIFEPRVWLAPNDY